jgi:hypothetical protein
MLSRRSKTGRRQCTGSEAAGSTVTCHSPSLTSKLRPPGFCLVAKIPFDSEYMSGAFQADELASSVQTKSAAHHTRPPVLLTKPTSKGAGATSSGSVQAGSARPS